MRHYPLSRILTGVFAAVLLFILPFVLPTIKVHLLIEILIFSLLSLSFNLLFGYGGMISFGHAGIFGVGAYVSALVFNHLHTLPLLLTLFLSGISGFIAASIIGAFCVRLNGTYFALITLAFQMFLLAIAIKWRTVTNGDDGISVVRPALQLPFIGNISMIDVNHLYFFILIVVVLGFLACRFLLKTPMGNSILCIRENEIRAAFLGYHVFLTKLAVFSVAGFLAGIAGGLYVFFTEFAATTYLDLNMSMTLLLITIIGGPSYFLGPVAGAAFYILMQDCLSSFTRYWLFLMGGIFIAIVLYAREGLVGLLITGGRKWSAWFLKRVRYGHS